MSEATYMKEIIALEQAFGNSKIFNLFYGFFSSDDQHLFGTGDEDYLVVKENHEHVHGFEGDDIITSISGRNDSVWIHAGEGNDIIYGTNQTTNGEIIEGEEGNDTIIGDTRLSQNIDTLSGGEGDDVIFDYSNGLIEGGAGNDIIHIKQASSLLYVDIENAGMGNDTVIGMNAQSQLQIDNDIFATVEEARSHISYQDVNQNGIQDAVIDLNSRGSITLLDIASLVPDISII